MRPIAVLLLALSLLGVGCVHKVRVESEPPGARVVVDKRVRGNTPVEFLMVSAPPFLRRYNMTVNLPGYRKVEAKGTWLRPSPLRREVRLWRYLLHPFRFRMIVGVAPRSVYNFILVPEHGPAGTWSPEDVPR